MGRNQYWTGRVYDLCVNYITGTPEGSTESGFMEKPGIEPATPGLQGKALIHYTTVVCRLQRSFYGDLVYKLKNSVGTYNFSAQFIKLISNYKKLVKH